MRGFCGAVAPAANTITREHVNMNRVIGDWDWTAVGRVRNHQPPAAQASPIRATVRVLEKHTKNLD